MVPDGRTDGRNGRTDGRTDGRTHGRCQNYIPPTSSGDKKMTSSWSGIKKETNYQEGKIYFNGYNHVKKHAQNMNSMQIVSHNHHVHYKTCIFVEDISD